MRTQLTTPHDGTRTCVVTAPLAGKKPGLVLAMRLLWAAALVLPGVVEAQFTYTTNNGTLTITGYTGSGGAVTIPATINGLPVTSLGFNAFCLCTSLTSVTVGNGVVSLGVQAFWGCTSLTTVTIGNSVQNIGDYAFSGCSSLTSVAMGTNVSDIGSEPFEGCTSLSAITVDVLNPFYSSEDGVLFNKHQTTLVLYPGGKAGAYTIPNSVNKVGDAAFINSTGLTSVTIPDSVASIGFDAFAFCASLASVKIGESVTIGHGVGSIGEQAFWHCTNLTTVTIGNSVKDIANNAFIECSSLTSVTIGANVINIVKSAFFGCTSLSAITVDPLNSVFSSENGVLFNQSQTTLILCPEGKAGAYTVPNSVTNVGDGAFASCDGLTSVTIPDSVATIGGGTFAGCTNLTNVTIGNGVASIGGQAFDGCTSLASVTIGANVASIGSGAFDGCTGLSAITVNALNSVFSSEDGVLLNKSQTTLILYPEGKAGAYTVPNSVTNIVDFAFVDCTGLTSVTIPDSVASIGFDAFVDCTSLASVAIGSSATTGHGVAIIGVQAFDGCTNLTRVTIGANVASIGTFAFADCADLRSVYFEGDAPAADLSVFYTDNSATVYHLPGTTGWGTTFGGLPAFLLDPLSQLAYTTTNGAITVTRYAGPGSAVTIPDSIAGLPVTSIEGYAFAGTAVTSVTIPNTITNIVETAFWGCTNLTAIRVDTRNAFYSDMDGVLFDQSLTTLIQYPAGIIGSYTIPNSVAKIGDYAFYSCMGLSSVTIPSSVTSIGDHAFDSCHSLANVTIGPNVASLGEAAFSGCTSLTSVYFEGNAPAADLTVFNADYSATVYDLPGTTGWGTTFGGRPAFLWDPLSQVAYTTANGTITVTGYTGPGSDVTIPDKIAGLPVTTIGDYAFAGSGLTSVTIPDNVTAIGDGAFGFCPSLASVTIGTNVSSIGDTVFVNCNNLISVAIPNSVTSIGRYAFAGAGLTNVTIPNSVTNIGEAAFGGCTNLTVITVDPRNSAYSDVDGVLLNRSLTTLLQYPAGITGSYRIPNSVTNIGTNAFYECYDLTAITIGTNVTGIGDGAFYACGSLTSVYFQGNAPNFGLDVFDHWVGSWHHQVQVWDPATIFYLPGTTGWTTNFAGRPTALWLPQVQSGGASFGVRARQFGFTINWTSGMTVVVEACTNLGSPIWHPLATNTLTSGSSYFSDPQWTNYPARFYRLRSP